MSDSAPFLIPSIHVAAWQMLPKQLLLWQSVEATHALVAGHRRQPGVGVGPPQSLSLSPWFCTPSLHVGIWHVFVGLPVQTRLVQSDGAPQILPLPQAGHPAPPQSVSVSVPFFTVSTHVAAWQVLVGLPLHTPVVQSAPVPQVFPTPQSAQFGPPQSLSLSLWFCTPSPQVGAAHWPAVHTPLWQSFGPRQALDVPHLLQPLDPPQSASVSVWFFTVSRQVGIWQTDPVQTLLVQSAPIAHALPFAHPAHEPPQSVSVSLPSLVPSLQF
jgi:hypothetical protein